MTSPRCSILICILVVTSCIHADELNHLANNDDSYREVEELLIEYIARELDLPQKNNENEDAMKWLLEANQKYLTSSAKRALLEWNLATNITLENEEKLAEGIIQYSKLMSELKEDSGKFNMANLDKNTRRQMRGYLLCGDPIDPNLVRQIAETSNAMTSIYNKGKICDEKRQHCLSLEPDLQDIMQQSHDTDQLYNAWNDWRDVTSSIRPLYSKFVSLKNEGARENGFSDYGEYWRESLFDQTPDLEENAANLWHDVQPLYLELHAYVRNKLSEFYGEDIVGNDGTIPAHILGNMWGQQWKGIYEIVKPYSSSNLSTEAEDNLKEKYDVEGLFDLSESFYSSIGLYNMTDTFWEKSMFIKPKDRDVQCHASAFDLYSLKDFRIKMCSEVNMDYFETIHHEMGHVEYYMAYEHQPAIYRQGANSAFHEAIGDTMALSVLSRKHLIAIGLLDDRAVNNNESDINTLLNRALYKIAFLPFGYLVDKWRYDVFRENVDTNYNKKWWKFRLKYQGITSPSPRSEDDFDPGAKFHIPANSAYMIYFYSYLLQFQFYKRLCDISGHQGELHTCDFYGSKIAGLELKKMMKLGSSIPWQDALEEFTGSREVSAKPLLEYFHPLMTWLKEENKNNGVTVGWEGAEIHWS